MDAIKDVVKIVIKDLSSDKSLGVSPEAVLKKTLTKRELEHIKLNNLKKGILSLNVDSASWHYQFNIKKEGLLQKIAKQLPEVKEIRFRIGDIR